VTAFDPLTGVVYRDSLAFEPSFTGGVFVG
jgi:hypothetical protein